MRREITKVEEIKYQSEIKKSRASADSYVFGYKKREMIDAEESKIVTLALGDDGAGWIPVGYCKIKTK